MVNKNYKPSMKPELIPEKRVGDQAVPAQIKVSGPYLGTLDISFENLQWLKSQCTGMSLCPEQYWFPDTPLTRVLLGVEQ